MDKFKLIPADKNQVYVAGSNGTIENIARTYRNAPGVANQHMVSAIFQPLNDTSTVLVFWAYGGFNLSNRDDIRILDVETMELLPAWELITG